MCRTRTRTTTPIYALGGPGDLGRGARRGPIHFPDGPRPPLPSLPRVSRHDRSQQDRASRGRDSDSDSDRRSGATASAGWRLPPPPSDQQAGQVDSTPPRSSVPVFPNPDQAPAAGGPPGRTSVGATSGSASHLRRLESAPLPPAAATLYLGAPTPADPIPRYGNCKPYHVVEDEMMQFFFGEEQTLIVIPL